MRFHAEKGADLLPAYFEGLRPIPNLRLMAAGQGPIWNEVHEACNPYPNGMIVGFIGDPRAFYEQLDFFFLLSREESFPQALLDACAMGLPFVAPDIPGTGCNELAAFTSAGNLFECGDVQSAVAATMTLITNLDMFKKKAQEGASKIRQAYRLTDMVNAFYEEVRK